MSMITLIWRPFILMCIISGTHAFSQVEFSKWYFGNFSGLDFTSSPPTFLSNGAINTSEGCSSVSDLNGNVLFYTDGVTVWNSNHAAMANGNGLFGNQSSAQSAVIV